MKKIIYILTLVILCSCQSKKLLPPVVEDFQLDRYLGTWYEIARYDNFFERNLNNVTAIYSVDSENNNKINILNRGYNTQKSKWKSVEGFAKVHSERRDYGLLRVTFMYPFFSDYRIMYLDDNYKYAIVGGSKNKYLWILSRTPVIDDSIRVKLLQEVDKLQYDIDELLYTDQSINSEN